MAKVTIVGAGVMGSALAVPLSDNGHEVALCGTQFDRAAIERIRADRWHPALQAPAPAQVRPFFFEELEQSLADAQVVVIGVISSAVRDLTQQIAPFLKAGMSLVNIAKGLEVAEDGGVRTLPVVVADALRELGAPGIPIIAIAGPCKALELAARQPTSVVFASSDESAAGECARIFSTGYYHVETTDDVHGLEVCAAVKNGYAIALGICDGIEKAANSASTMDNLKSAVFTQAVTEMAEMACMVGGRSETAYGLAGLGDLYVTVRQGRNLTLGRLMGEGLSFTVAHHSMQHATVEGIAAVQTAHRGLCAMAGEAAVHSKFPLLDFLSAVISRDADPSALPARLYSSP